jgi:hypothetical protein
MRKLWIAGAAAAVIAALSVTGIAFAVNTYNVNLGKTSPSKAKGSPSKPVPVAVDFGFTVGESTGLRPSVVVQYRIGAEGLWYYPKAVPSCTFSQADQSPKYASACNKAVVGHGSVNNQFGAANDRTVKGKCDVGLTLINLSNGPGITKKRGGVAIRIDGGPPACPLPLHRAISAPFFNTTIGGVKAQELRFTVPDNLVHPAPGVDNSIIKSVNKVLKRTGTVKINGKKVKVGFYSAIGIKGKKRTTRVTFVDETGHKFTAQTEFPK